MKTFHFLLFRPVLNQYWVLFRSRSLWEKHLSLVISATKIFAPFCPFLRYFPYRKKCSKKSEILLRYWQISQKKDKKPKIFVALMSDIATRRDCDIIATLSVATISQPCGSRYTDNITSNLFTVLQYTIYSINSADDEYYHSYVTNGDASMP